MADRAYRETIMTPQAKMVAIPVVFKPDTTTGAEQLIEGAGNHVVVSKTATAGQYTITTVNPFPGFLGCTQPTLFLNAAQNIYGQFGVPVQNANNTWTITLNLYAGGGTVATDLTLNAANRISFVLTMRNSTAA